MQRWICASKARLTLSYGLGADVVVLQIVQGKLKSQGPNFEKVDLEGQ